MRILSALILSAICFALSAQLPSDMRSEQVYLSVQSSEVEAGDSINLQGLVACASNQGMKPYSRYVYVELIGFDNDSVLVRQKVACNASGQFATKVATDRPTGIGNTIRESIHSTHAKLFARLFCIETNRCKPQIPSTQHSRQR